MIQFKRIDWFKTAYLFLAIVFAVLWLRGCGAPQATRLVKVDVPEVKGTFKPQKPINTPVVKTSYLPKNDKSYFNKSKKAIVQNEPVVKNDTKITIDTSSIVKEPCEQQLNNFSTKFENDDIELNIEGVAEGTVKEITPSYKIKKKTIEVPVKVKETVLRVLVGAEVGVQTSLEMNKLPLKANLMFQNRKGNIWSASIDNNQTAWIGFNVTIFNWKK